MTKHSKSKQPYIVPSPQRSAIMRAVKGKDTSPELCLRALLKSKRFKFEIYPMLPGKPDIILPSRKVAIRVMGCFWHAHSCRHGKRKPKANSDFWAAKFTSNRKRDRKNKADLKALGWKVLDVWECHMKKKNFERSFVKKIKCNTHKINGKSATKNLLH